jgi:predicted CXXCH cytochrome family protein
VTYTFQIFSLLLVLSCAAIAAVDQCQTCHQGLEDKPSALFRKDIHAQKGISCADCHGGNRHAEDMEDGMSEKAGFIGVPKGNAIAERCATCHSSVEKMASFGSTLRVGQREMLQASVHGHTAVRGGEQIAQCTTCHGAHGIVPVNNPASPVHPLRIVATCGSCHSDASFMRQYNPSLPVDQVAKYRTSNHGKANAKGDAKVAECASCHGSHDIRSVKDAKSSVYPTNIPATCGVCHSDPQYMAGRNIPTDQLAKFSSSVHGVALLEKHDLAAPACNNCHGNHGAAPPGVESVSKVCGTCHALNADLFASSPHKKAFDQRKLPECETCHGNHQIVAATDKLLGVTPEAVCSKCHTEHENPKGFLVAQRMRALIDSLEQMEQIGNELVGEAEQKGMEISEAKFMLRDVRQARLQSRTKVHGFALPQFQEVVDKGFVAASLVNTEAREAIDEYYFRRWGLGVATVIISLVASLLYAHIRQIDKRQRNTTNTKAPV